MKQIRTSGFTLIELMIVVVIIGILTGIAYPSYSNYMRQTRRSDAQIALSRIAATQEKFYSDCGYYATTLAGTRDCGAVGTATAILGYDPTSSLSPDRHYQLSLAAGTVAVTCSTYNCGFTATANPAPAAGVTGRQANDGRFRLDSTGVKGWDKAGNGAFSSRWTDK